MMAVVPLEVYLYVHMGFLYTVRNGVLSALGFTMVSRNGVTPSCLLFSTVNLMGGVHTADIFQKVLFMFFLFDNKGGIHVSQPKPGGSGSSHGCPFKVFHVQVSHYGADWGPHGCPFYLFTELALKGKISFV